MTNKHKKKTVELFKQWANSHCHFCGFTVKSEDFEISDVALDDEDEPFHISCERQYQDERNQWGDFLETARGA